MVRVDGWDGPEMVASVRATRHLKNGQNYCIERFAGPLDTFRSAVAEVVGLGVASLAVEAATNFTSPVSTQRGETTSALVEAARKHDARFFGASFANASHGTMRVILCWPSTLACARCRN